MQINWFTLTIDLTVLGLGLLLAWRTQKRIDTMYRWLESHLLFLVVLIGGLLVVAYRQAEDINPATFGSPERYGALGDFMGGMLNPALSFLTLVLVLRTFKLNQVDHQKKKRESDSARINILLAEAEARHRSLIEAKKFNNTLPTMCSLPDYCNPMTGDINQDTIDFHRERKADLANYLTHIKEQPDEAFDLFKWEGKYTHYSNIQNLKEIRNLTLEMIDLYLFLVDYDEIAAVNLYNIRRLDSFLDAALLYVIITEEEYDYFMEQAFINAGGKPTNFVSIKGRY